MTELYADNIELLGGRPVINNAAAATTAGAPAAQVNVQQNIQNALNNNDDNLPF